LEKGNTFTLDNDGGLYYFKDNRLYRTTDNGITNTDISPNEYEPEWGFHDHVFYTENKKLILTYNFRPNNIPRLYSSDDFGNSWDYIELSEPITGAIYYNNYLITNKSLLSFTSIDSGLIYSYDLSDLDLNTFKAINIMQDSTIFATGKTSTYNGTSLLAKSTDFGESFSLHELTGIPNDLQSRVLHTTPKNEILAIANYLSHDSIRRSIFVCENYEDDSLHFEEIELNDLIEGKVLTKFFVSKNKYGYLVDSEDNIYSTQNSLSEPNSIKAESQKVKWNVFPNPSRNQFKVEVEGDFMKYFVEVFSLDGRRINCCIGIQNNFVEINDLSSGVYFIKLSLNDEFLGFKKIVVIH